MTREDDEKAILGDSAVLTLRYEATAADGKPLPPWRATSVYHRAAGEWRIVHAHWSLAQESQQASCDSSRAP